MTVAELEALRAAGEVVVPVDRAKPWEILGVSRATLYRALQRGEVPGVLRLGRRRLLRIDVFVRWLAGEVLSPVEASEKKHLSRIDDGGVGDAVQRLLAGGH